MAVVAFEEAQRKTAPAQAEPMTHVFLYNNLVLVSQRVDIHCPEGVAVLLAMIQVGPHLGRDRVWYPVHSPCRQRGEQLISLRVV